MTEPQAMDYALVAMMGAFGGSSAMALFLLLTKLKGEEGMGCKAHGECLGCRLDVAEDIARQLDAKYGSLWSVMEDIESKVNQKHAQMKEYVDEQLRKIEARLTEHAHRINGAERVDTKK